jgi:membrane dipeptidase
MADRDSETGSEVALARRLGVSLEAVQAARTCEMIDLHIDTFIPMRLFRYDIARHHGDGRLGGRMFGHLDLPRMSEGGLGAAMWSVTTNPLRTAGSRWRTAVRNFRRLRAALEASGQAVVVASHAEYLAARRAGRHACLLSIQGGNALDAAPPDDPRPDPALLRVTLVHLTSSEVGQSSMPVQLRHEEGLTDHGRELVQRLNARRIFVDLAHIAPRGFWAALEVHDRSQPVLVTHTGVCGVTPHWRNIDDAQIRAVAATGGTIGIMFHEAFVRRPGPRDCSQVVDHMAHVIRLVGDDHVSLGSDYDGAITPTPDLRSGDSYPRLVQNMLARGWSTTRIEKILGGNFLRTLRQLRPGV